MNIKNLFGLRFKIISIIFLFFIFLIISFYAFFYNYFLGEMLLNEEDKINIYTSTIVSDLNKDIKNLSEYMRFISSLDNIKTLIKSELDKILLYYNNYNFSINNFFIFDTSGLIISSPKNKKLIGVNVFGNSDFNIQQFEDKISIRSVYINDNFSIIIYAPIIDDNGKLVSMIAGFLNLENDELQIYDSIVLPYYDWKILLVDKKGMLIYHSHQKTNKLTLKERNYSNYPSVNNALKGYWGLKNVRIDNLIYYSSSEFISSSDWIIIVEVPKFIVVDKVNKILKRQALYIIIFFIILLIIQIFFIDKIIKPLYYLTESLNSYGEEKNFKLLSLKGNDEVSKAIKAFNNMIRDRNNLEREVIEISEDERIKVGLDLHDDIGQILTGIAFQGMMLEKDLKNKKGITYIKEILNLTSDAINKVKYLAKGLCPVALNDNGLIYAVEELLDNIKKIYKIECTFIKDDIIINNQMVSLNLFYIIQESVNNAVKHGKPTRIDVSLSRVNNDIVVKIIDNGKGFEGENKKGMGLKIMKYRARLINAVLEYNSKINKGTSIICRKELL